MNPLICRDRNRFARLSPPRIRSDVLALPLDWRSRSRRASRRKDSLRSKLSECKKVDAIAAFCPVPPADFGRCVPTVRPGCAARRPPPAPPWQPAAAVPAWGVGASRLRRPPPRSPRPLALAFRAESPRPRRGGRRKINQCEAHVSGCLGECASSGSSCPGRAGGCRRLEILGFGLTAVGFGERSWLLSDSAGLVLGRSPSRRL